MNSYVSGCQPLFRQVKDGGRTGDEPVDGQRININIHLAMQVQSTQHRFGPLSVSSSVGFLAVDANLGKRICQNEIIIPNDSKYTKILALTRYPTHSGSGEGNQAITSPSLPTLRVILRSEAVNDNKMQLIYGGKKPSRSGQCVVSYVGREVDPPRAER